VAGSICTPTSTSAVTIRILFASLGLPEVVVSDNATTFTNDEFKQFLKKNGIRHITITQYVSNGLVERVVQTFKEGMRKLTEGSVETRLAHLNVV